MSRFKEAYEQVQVSRQEEEKLLSELTGTGEAFLKVAKKVVKAHDKAWGAVETAPKRTRKLLGKAKYYDSQLDRVQNINSRLGWRESKNRAKAKFMLGRLKLDRAERDSDEYHDKAAASVKQLGRSFKKRSDKFKKYA